MPKIKNIQATIDFRPRPYQVEAHRNRKRWNILVWHRRSGKTHYSIIELLLGALSCPRPAGRYAYIAPFYGQAKSVAWDILKTYCRSVPGCIVREGDLTVLIPRRGSSIRLFGADNPDSLRGLYFDGLVMDEVANMKPDLWGSVLRPALSDREGWALFIGTPAGINLFSEIYYAGLKDPEWYADLKRASETKIIPEAELQSARQAMSAQQYDQEFECDFSVGNARVLIPVSLVLASQNRKYALHDYHYAPKIIGVDPAWEGDDRSTIVMRQGVVATILGVYSKIGNIELAELVNQFANQHQADAIFIDAGMGAGVNDALRRYGKDPQIVYFGGRATKEGFSNKRTEMWWDMKQWLEEGGQIPNSQDLLNDLIAPELEFSLSNGKKNLESKKSMKSRGLQSPDLGDALALTFYTQVSPRSELARFSAQTNTCQTHYNIFD